MLGEGSFGIVFKVVDFANQFYAMKIIQSGDCDEMGQEQLEEVKSEIAITSKLVHPNIIRLLSSEYLEGESIIANLFELAECNLSTIVGNLSEDKAMKIFLDICNGVKYLYSQYFIHRDIKPSNILLVEGNAKLSDFGLVKFLPPSDKFIDNYT